MKVETMKEQLKDIPDTAETSNYIPEMDPNYVCYGNYADVKQIIESRNFFPVWITGNAGNGKTQMIKQACAETGREFVRFNFTVETDENDLLGGMRLVEKNGVTVSEFCEGPITIAMRRGAIVLLDEIDVGHTNKIMCLQSILEGQGVLLKAKNEFVKPAPGFNIFATSNTKGRGSEDGRFLGTQIMNAAFLDRFAAMMYQDYPDKKMEQAILQNYFIDIMWLSKDIAIEDVPSAKAKEGEVFIRTLCDWAAQIRETYKNQGISEVVTTRTLINILRGYAIFENRQKSILYACERYPDDVRDQFVAIFDKLQDEPIMEAQSEKTVPDSEDANYMSFKQQKF